MIETSTVGVGNTNSLNNRGGFVRWLPLVPAIVLAVVVLAAVTGCQTPKASEPVETSSDHLELITLREGDIVKISFPGAPNLDTTQEIRRDGKIVLVLVGEVTAVGLTPAELEKQIVKLYSTQLVSKEVTVTVVSSSFPVFVTGAVLRPGKILSNRPITALEAIMEAGGFIYTKANLRGVIVIRHEEGRVKNYTLNMKLMLEGKQSVPFYLKPSDVVYVPERFSWF
jgi:polysaccharide export outer membrane protein